MPYTSNPKLITLPLPFEWNGTPINEKGRFMNHEFQFVDSFRDLLKWQTSRNPQKLEKKTDTWKPEVMYNQGFLESEEDCIVWLGHASFLSGWQVLLF